MSRHFLDLFFRLDGQFAHMSSSGDEHSSELSGLNSCSQTADRSQNFNNSKQPKVNFCAWNLLFSHETDLLSIQDFVLDEQKRCIAEHLRTRLGQNQPHIILSVKVFCNFRLVVVPPQDEWSFISIPNVGFVKSKSRTVHTSSQMLHGPGSRFPAAYPATRIFNSLWTL